MWQIVDENGKPYSGTDAVFVGAAADGQVRGKSAVVRFTLDKPRNLRVVARHGDSADDTTNFSLRPGGRK